MESQILFRILGATFIIRTSSTINRQILIMMNWNIITNSNWRSNESLIFNRNIKIMIENLSINSLNWLIDYFVIGFKNRFGLIVFNGQMFFSETGSDNILSIIDIPWSLDSFSSQFILINGLLLNSSLINKIIFSLDKLNLQIFFFINRLYDWLIDYLTSRKRYFLLIN